MISIRKATTELERMEEMLSTLSVSFEQSIRSTGQYAIEVNPGDTELFRQHLETLRTQLAASNDPEVWQSIEASFRGELRDYRDKSQEHLKLLRGEIAAALDAMTAFGDAVTLSGADHEMQIRASMDRLSAVAGSNSLKEIRESIQTSIAAIASSLESMQRSHQASVAQMRDEIRLLHAQVDLERRSAYTDRVTGVWNRQKLDSHIAALLNNDERFCVVMVCVRNLRHLDLRYSKTLIAGALKAFLQRFSAMLGENVVIGRWNEEHFVAILDDAAAAAPIARQAATRLSGTYSVQENGLSNSVALHAMAGLVDCPAGTTDHLLQHRLLQMTQTLNGG